MHLVSLLLLLDLYFCIDFFGHGHVSYIALDFMLLFIFSLRIFYFVFVFLIIIFGPDHRLYIWDVMDL